MTVLNELCDRFGIIDATVFQFLLFWQESNRINKRYYKEESHWVKCSVAKMTGYLSGLSFGNCRYALDRLLAQGVIERKNLNETAYLRTYWYRITDEALYNEMVKKLKIKKKKLAKEEAVLTVAAAPLDERAEVIRALETRGLIPNQIKTVLDKFDILYLSEKIEQHDHVKKYFIYRMIQKGTRQPNPPRYLYSSIMGDWIDRDFQEYRLKENAKRDQVIVADALKQAEEAYAEYLHNESWRLFEALTPDDKIAIETEAKKELDAHIAELPDASFYSNEMIYQTSLKGYITELLATRFESQLLSRSEFFKQQE